MARCILLQNVSRCLVIEGKVLKAKSSRAGDIPGTEPVLPSNVSGDVIVFRTNQSDSDNGMF